MANENLKMVPKAFGNWKLAGEQMYLGGPLGVGENFFIYPYDSQLNFKK